MKKTLIFLLISALLFSFGCHPFEPGVDKSEVPVINESETDFSVEVSQAVSEASEESFEASAEESSEISEESSDTSEEESSEDSEEPSEDISYPNGTEQVSALKVEHLFTHCLIADPTGKVMHDPNSSSAQNNLTVTEFKRLLQSLYDRDYCLIDIYDMYTVKDGKAVLADTVTVPKGKKPLVISVDNVCYEGGRSSSGYVDKIVIENDTIMGCFEEPDGTRTYTDKEVFPILEEFLLTHPDFSYNGAKVTLAISAYFGILGYRTDEKYRGKKDVDEERRQALIVIDWLISHGYNFACHSYSHSDYRKCSAEQIKSDFEKWKINVEPLIGKTDIFVYPHGADPKYNSVNHQLLLDEGFLVFCDCSSESILRPDKHPNDSNGYESGTGTIYLSRLTVAGGVIHKYSSLVDYYMDNGFTEEEARSMGTHKNYEKYRSNYLKFFIPEEIYEGESRYKQIHLP